MRKTFHLLAMALSGVLLSATLAASGNVRKVLFVEDPWPPYTIGNEAEAPSGGVAPDILKNLFGRLGVAVNLELHPWTRCLKMAETGQADGLMLVIKDPERDPFLALTEPVFEARESFFYRPDRLGDLRWESFADLRRHTFGLVSGFTYTEAFAQAVKALPLKVEYATTSEENLRKLFLGRVDIIEDDEVVVARLLADHPDWQAAIRRAEKPVDTFIFYIGVSRKSPAMDLIPEMNRAIRAMQADGTMDRILGRGK